MSHAFLRLVGVDDAGDSIGSTPTAAWTLSQLWEGYLLPICYEQRDAQPATLKQIAESLTCWRAFTGDPPLARITAVTCAAFVKMLRRLPSNRPRTPKGRSPEKWLQLLAEKTAERPISRNTLLKHVRTLQRLLDLAGPSTRKNRSAAGVLDRIPWFDAPEADPPGDCDVLTLEELRAWIDACRFARYPHKEQTGVEPAVWWVSLLLCMYNTGLRIGTSQRAAWSWFDAGGTVLRVPPSGIKRRRAKSLFVNEPARAAMAVLAVPGRDLIWGFPGWPKSESYLRRLRLELQERAGLPPERRLGFHAIRATTATAVTELTGDLSLAQLQLGHGAATTTANHYTRIQRAGRKLNELPQP